MHAGASLAGQRGSIARDVCGRTLDPRVNDDGLTDLEPLQEA
jgi:hypothetical protein